MSTQVEIQRFNGFTAVDGTVHKTHALAVAHTVEVKTKEALKAVAETIFKSSQDHNGVTTPGFTEGDGVIAIDGHPGLATVLYTHRDAIRAALDQKVVLRKPRTPNKIAKAS